MNNAPSSLVCGSAEGTNSKRIVHFRSFNATSASASPPHRNIPAEGIFIVWHVDYGPTIEMRASACLRSRFLSEARVVAAEMTTQSSPDLRHRRPSFRATENRREVRGRLNLTIEDLVSEVFARLVACLSTTASFRHQGANGLPHEGDQRRQHRNLNPSQILVTEPGDQPRCAAGRHRRAGRRSALSVKPDVERITERASELPRHQTRGQDSSC